MTIYVIIIFLAICLGMAVSVWAFGTGGKRSRIFQDIYFTIEETEGIGVLYSKTGEVSAMIRLENPVAKFGGNIDAYYDYTKLFSAICATLGEDYALHKQDVFTRRKFSDDSGEKREFLSDSYFGYFKNREYTDSFTYLTITQECKKSRLFSYDGKKWRDFLVKIRKVADQLRDAGIKASFLNREEASAAVDRFFAMDFANRRISVSSFKADEECVGMGDRNCKIYSLVDVDCINLPTQIRPYTKIEVTTPLSPLT